MKLTRKLLLHAILLLSLFFAGCVTDPYYNGGYGSGGYGGPRIVPSGNDFNRDHLTKIQLGESTKAQCVAWFGQPKTNEEIKREYADFELYNYAYSQYDVYTNRPVGVRLLQLEFVDDVINSFFYVSSFDEHRKYIDFSVADKFEKGVTGMEDVMWELGLPNGKARHPTNSEMFRDMRSYEELVWIRDTIGETDVVTHTLKVGFDAENKMMYANSSKKTKRL